MRVAQRSLKKPLYFGAELVAVRDGFNLKQGRQDICKLLVRGYLFETGRGVAKRCPLH